MSKTKWTITKLIIVVVVTFPILYKLMSWFKQITSTKILTGLIIYYKSIDQDKAAKSIEDVTNYFNTLIIFSAIFLVLLVFTFILPIAYIMTRMSIKSNNQIVRDLRTYYMTIIILYLATLFISLAFLSFSPLVLNLEYSILISQVIMIGVLAFFFTGFSVADRLSNKVYKRIKRGHINEQEEVVIKKDSKRMVVLLFFIVILLVINANMIVSSMEQFNEKRKELTVPEQLILNDDAQFILFGKSCTSWTISCRDDKTHLFSNYTLEEISIIVNKETVKSFLKSGDFSLVIMIKGEKTLYVAIKSVDITITEQDHTLTYHIDFTNYVTEEMKDIGLSEVSVSFNDLNTGRYHDDIPIHYWEAFEIKLKKVDNT